MPEITHVLYILTSIWVLLQTLVVISFLSCFSHILHHFDAKKPSWRDAVKCISQFIDLVTRPYYSELIFSPLPGFEPGASPVASRRANQ